jgi:hypothetical protein
MLTISYNHSAEIFDESILIDNEPLSLVINSMTEDQERNAINKVIELFKKARKENKTVNSEIIAKYIAETLMDDEDEIVLVSILAGAKAYSSSTEVRIIALNLLSNNSKSPSKGIEEFQTTDYLKKRYSDNPQLITITTLMTVGLVFGAIADLVDVICEPKHKPRSVKAFHKAVLN